MAEDGMGGGAFGRQFDVESGELSASSEAKVKGKKKIVVALLRTQCNAHGKLLLVLVLAAFVTAWWLCQSTTLPQVPTTPIQEVDGKRSGLQDSGNLMKMHVRERDKESEPHRVFVKSQKPSQPEHGGQEPRAGADQTLDADICSELGFDEHSLGEKPLVPLVHNNVTVPGFVNAGHYVYFQLCIDNTRDYFHVVEVFLDPVIQPDESVGNSINNRLRKSRAMRKAEIAADVDMYLSAHITHPTVQQATWIAAKRGPDHIKLYTDLNDWSQTSRTLYIGVLARKADTFFSIRPLVYRKEGSHRGDALIGPDTIHRGGRVSNAHSHRGK